MGKTSIEWADFTVNPFRAVQHRHSDPFGGSIVAKGHYCEKISPGCAHCYASTLQKRFRMPAFPGVTRDDQTVRLDGSMRNGVEPYLDEKALDQIRRRKKPTRWFVCDMTDPFGWWVRDEWLGRLFATFAICPQHTFMLLTKRPQRMLEFLSDPVRQAMYSGKAGFDLQFPLPNVWLGVSAEDQKRYDERVCILEETPAAVRFVSAEPLLDAIDFVRECNYCDGHGDVPAPGDRRKTCPRCKGSGGVLPVDWVIFGGESGHNARPCNIEWIRSGVQQCRDAGVNAFVKQLGTNPIYGRSSFERTELKGGFMIQGSAEWGTLKFEHSKGGDIAEWPADLQIRQFPQVQA